MLGEGETLKEASLSEKAMGKEILTEGLQAGAEGST